MRQSEIPFGKKVKKSHQPQTEPKHAASKRIDSGDSALSAEFSASREDTTNDVKLKEKDEAEAQVVGDAKQQQQRQQEEPPSEEDEKARNVTEKELRKYWAEEQNKRTFRRGWLHFPPYVWSSLD